MPDSIVIVSGGMDSVTLLHYLVKRVLLTPLVMTFVYGQKHSKEVEFARHHVLTLGCKEPLLLDLSLLTPAFASSALVAPDMVIPEMADVQGDSQPPTYVPNRNMIFLTIAAAFAETRGVTDIFYGAQRHDLYGYWDTTPDFIARMNAVFALNRTNAIRVQAPFVSYSKADILRVGLELGVDYSKTWSCYEGADVACGVCPTCAERLQAFQELGRPDPIPYRTE